MSSGSTRGPSSSHPDRVFPVLPSFPASSVLGSQLTNTPQHRTAVRGRSCCHPASRRLTPSVHTACRVTIDPSFQFDLSSAQADRADVPKLRSRKIPGFFAAIFSVVTQFDLHPVGWYNRQMEFLGRTGLPLRCGRSRDDARGFVARFSISWNGIMSIGPTRPWVVGHRMKSTSIVFLPTGGRDLNRGFGGRGVHYVRGLGRW